MSTIAVVTGAGRGLGRKIAERLARRGHHVLVTDIDGEAARATAAGLPGAWALAHDVRDPDAHRAVAAAARERGSLAVWVNNAGVLDVGEAWRMPDSIVRRMVEVNLMGVIWGCHAAVPALDEGGHLINIASIAGLVAAPGMATYAATKHGVLGYTIALAGEARRAGRHIRVSALCPDAIAGDMTGAVAHDPAAGVLFSSGEMLTLDEVADAAVELLDAPRLVRTVPALKGAFAHVFHAFPSLGLPLLEQIAKRGRKRQRS